MISQKRIAVKNCIHVLLLLSLICALLSACGGGTSASNAAPPPGPVSSELIWNVVTERGIVPNNAKPGLDAVIADATSYLLSHPTETLVLYFPAGTYTFVHPAGPAIALQNFSSGKLHFRGAGSNLTKFVFSQFDQRGFELESTNFVTIEALELSRPTIYTSQGDVTEVTPGHVKFKVQTGFPDPVLLMNAPNAQDNQRTLVRFRGDPLDPELAPNSNQIALSSMTSLNNGFYDAVLVDGLQLADLQVGDQVALKAKVGDKTIAAIDSNDFTVQDVTITRRSAVAIEVGGASDRTLIQRVVIARDPPINGHTPFFSGPGGGPQLTANTVGPTIQDCTIAGTTDDSIAIFANNMAALPSGAIIRNNHIRDSQGRGINVTQSLNGMMTNNTITRTVNASIQMRLTSAANGQSSDAVKGWTVSHNTLIQGSADPVIWLNKDNGSVGGGLHTNISIDGNIFILAPKDTPLIQVENSDDILVTNNTIVSFSLETGVPVAAGSQPAPLVYVQSGKNVHGTGNTTQVPTSRTAVVVEAGSNATLNWSIAP